jgi:DNA-binding response OmpR family regulator
MTTIHLHIVGQKAFSNLLDELGFNYIISFGKILKFSSQDSFVRIVFPEALQLTVAKKYFIENIPTIFLLNNKEYLLKNKLSLLEFHVSLNTPLEILSFREILNILLTKHNFFKKSKIVISDYEIDSNQRLIMKNGLKVKLTEKELELILTLNNNGGLDKSFLLKNIWNYNPNLETHAFETHLHRLRKKINNTFKDNKFIIEKNYKYYLLAK